MNNSIWSYLEMQNTLEDIYVDDEPPTSFKKFLKKSSIFTPKCQFIVLGKVTEYRENHIELKPFRNGYLCFYSLNSPFEAKNIEVFVGLQQLFQLPLNKKFLPLIAKYPGSKKNAYEDMFKYFNQYIKVNINGIEFVILKKYEFDYVRQFFRKLNMNWIMHIYQEWDKIVKTVI